MARSISLFGLLAMVASTPASAADFTFDVPIHLSNLPRVTRAHVECFVSTLPAGATGWAGGTNVIGRNGAFIDLVDGRYDGTVTVAIENTTSRPSSEARSYGCFLEGNARNDSGAMVPLYPGVWTRTIQSLTGNPLDRESTSIEAPLP